jgi:hypothetical protein
MKRPAMTRTRATAPERPHGVRRHWIPVLATLMLTMLVLAIPPVPTTSAAPATGARAQLILESMTPAAITPGSTVRITGRIVNTGSVPLSGLRAGLLSRYSPLTARSQISTWIETPDAPVDAPERASTAIATSLDPRQSTVFTLTLPAEDLQFPNTASSFGARAAGVEIWSGSGGTRTRLAVQRTFLVWTPEISSSPTRLTLVTPVTSTIPQADSTRPDAALLASMDSGGRLDELLRATDDRAFTWMLDPSLLTAAQETASGAQPENTTTGDTPTSEDTSDPTTTSGGTADTGTDPSADTSSSDSITGTTTPEQAAAATRWLQRLTTGLDGREVTALPFGDPDVAALAHAGTTGLMTLAQGLARTGTEEVLDLQLRTDVALPAGGTADPTTLAMLSETGSTSVILSADSQPPQQELTYTPSGRSSLPLADWYPLRGLLYDPVLSAELAATGSAEPTVATQALLADLATLTAERPNDSRSVLVVTPRDWTPDPAGVTSTLQALRSVSPWLRLDPLSALESTPEPAVDRVEPDHPATAREAELPETAIAPVVTALDELDQFTPALTDPVSVVRPMNRTAALLTSVRWRGRTTEQTRATEGFTGQVTTLYDGVSILPSGPKILVSRSLSPMLVTLENQLDQPVHVILRLRPRTGRLQVPHTVGVTLDAHRRQTVRIQVRAVANGDVQVDASVLTTRGEIIATAAPITVHVHSDWENRALAISGGLLLLLVAAGLIRGIRRGRVRIPPEHVPDADEEVMRRDSRSRDPRPEADESRPEADESRPGTEPEEADPTAPDGSDADHTDADHVEDTDSTEDTGGSDPEPPTTPRNPT